MIRGTENKKLWQSNEQQPYNGAHIIFTTDDGVNLGHYDASDNSECPYLDTYRGIWLSPRQIKEWCYLDDIIAQADKAERLQKEITQELDIYYSPNPSLHPADDCVYAIEKIIGYKRPKEDQ